VLGALTTGACHRPRHNALARRSLVGLERDAAAEAFSRFLDDRTYTRTQIDFTWAVVTHLTERGVMDVDLLYEPPFTDHAPQAEDLFSGSDVDLVHTLTAFRPSAGLAEGVAWPTHASDSQERGTSPTTAATGG
jgi:hypothetical protein